MKIFVADRYLKALDRIEELEREVEEIKALCDDGDEETMMYYRMWCEATGRDPDEPKP